MVDLACLNFDPCDQHQWSVTIWFIWKLWDKYAENSSMKDSVWSIGINTTFIVIVNYFFSVHLYVPHHYIDKLNRDMVLCKICAMQVLDVDLPIGTSGKYCICKATVGGAQSIAKCKKCSTMHYGRFISWNGWAESILFCASGDSATRENVMITAL